MDKLEELKKKIEQFQAKSAAKEEIQAFVTLAVGVLKKYKETFDSISSENLTQIKEVVDYLETQKGEILADVKSKTDKTVKSFDKKLKEAKDLLFEIQMIEVRDGVDGKDADEQKIVEEVLSKIKLPEYDKVVLDGGAEIVSKINELDTDDEDLKIDASHIKNLPEHTREIANEIVRGTTGNIEVYSSTGKVGSSQRLRITGATITNDADGAVRVDITGGGASSFLGLTDTPSSYTGQSLKAVRVNAGETGLEFFTLSGGGDALTSNPLSQFASTTSAQLAGVISDETGFSTGAKLVFSISPDLTTPDINVATADSLQAGTTSAGLLIKNNAGTTVASFGVGGASSTNIALIGNTVVTGNISATNLSGTNTGDQSLSIAAGSAGAIQVTDGSGNFIGSHTDYLFYDTSNNLLYLLDETTTYFKTGDYTTGFNFNADSISGSTIRTYTAPDADGTLVLTDFAQTLDNKAIDASTNTITNIGASEIEVGIITDLTAETTIASDDVIMIYDTSASALRKMTRANFVSGLGGGGSGDVVGPASATDNAIARFDSTTGKLIQNSVVTIADTTGDMAGVGTLNTHTIPGGTGTFALTSDLSAYVPYTGATTDLDLGTNDLLTPRVEGTVASGLTLSSTGNPLSLITDTDVIIDTEGTGNYARLRTQLLAGSVNLEFPNASGTFALTSDLHSAVTVTDSSTVDLTLTGQDITADVIDNSITYAKLQQGGAYKMMANNTASTANYAEVGFQDPTVQTLVSTDLTWNGSAPSGTYNGFYSWTRVGNMVEFQMAGTFASAGSANTSLIVAWQSDMPEPIQPTGYTAASAKIFLVSARVDTGAVTSVSTPNWVTSFIRRNSADTAFEVFITGASTAVRGFYITGRYWV